MMDDHLLSRRHALKYLGILTATVAGREFASSWLAGASAHAGKHRELIGISGMRHEIQEPEEPAALYKPQYFNSEEFQSVEILTALILPTDEGPGAKEARVADYIDFVVFSAAEFEPSLQKEWNAGLAFVERESQHQFKKSFRDASSFDRVKLLTEMSLPERDAKAHHNGFSFFSLLKDMTVEGFYTSKIGLIDVLDYQGMNYMPDFPGCTHPEHQS